MGDLVLCVADMKAMKQFVLAALKDLVGCRNDKQVPCSRHVECCCFFV